MDKLFAGLSFALLNEIGQENKVDNTTVGVIALAAMHLFEMVSEFSRYHDIGHWPVHCKLWKSARNRLQSPEKKTKLTCP